MAYQFAATFAGTMQPKSVDYVVSQGREPSRARITMLPQDVSLIPRIGSLVLEAKNSITIPLMYVDQASIVLDQNGQAIELQLMDRRWRWQYSRITKYANLPHLSGKPGQAVRVNARQLCLNLVSAMGESGNMDLVPNNDYPPVAWKESNAASELESLLNSYGLEIDLNVFNGTVSAVRPGQGSIPSAPLSDLIFNSEGIDHAEGPETIRIVGGEYRFQTYVQLEAVAKEPGTNTYVPYDEVSYAPVGGWESEDPDDLLPDEEDAVIRSAARDSVWKAYRISGFPSGDEVSTEIPGWDGTQPESLNDILPIDKYLIENYIDSEGRERPLLPYVRGSFASGKQALYRMDDGNTSVSELLEGSWKLDRQNGIVFFDFPVYRLNESGGAIPALLYLKCSFRLRESTTNLKGFYIFDELTGISLGFGIETVHVDDLTPLYISSYNNDNPQGSITNTNNSSELNTVASAIADVKKAAYTDTASYARSYRFIHGVDTSGIVRQVRWELNEQIARTTVYLNNFASMAAMTGLQRKRASGAYDAFVNNQRVRLISHVESEKPKET